MVPSLHLHTFPSPEDSAKHGFRGQQLVEHRPRGGSQTRERAARDIINFWASAIITNYHTRQVWPSGCWFSVAYPSGRTSTMARLKDPTRRCLPTNKKAFSARRVARRPLKSAPKYIPGIYPNCYPSPPTLDPKRSHDSATTTK